MSLPTSLDEVTREDLPEEENEARRVYAELLAQNAPISTGKTLDFDSWEETGSWSLLLNDYTAGWYWKLKYDSYEGYSYERFHDDSMSRGRSLKGKKAIEKFEEVLGYHSLPKSGKPRRITVTLVVEDQRDTADEDETDSLEFLLGAKIKSTLYDLVSIDAKTTRE